MIDPYNITNYQRTPSELEEFLLFAIMVAGKRADRQALALERFLTIAYREQPVGIHPPLVLVRRLHVLGKLRSALEWARVGQYTRIMKALEYLAECEPQGNVSYEGRNIRFASAGVLQQIPGVGPKTSRFFILHTQEGAQVACLDTHLLKFLKAIGVKDVPRSTPTSMAKYRRLEAEFLDFCQLVGTSPAQLDLGVWTWYARRSRPSAGSKGGAASADMTTSLSSNVIA